MFARTGVYEFPEEARDETVQAFRDALDQISDCSGFRGGWFLLACDSDRALTLTLWETRDAMEASRVKASRLRSEAAGRAGGGVVSAEEFEVAVETMSRDLAAP
ncbi:MAG: antibiotic biosynthesis monooxygenase [Thermoleophilia bacterium]|nr:antibiotic biosynthesis monooxygenase [Thermoleophilia bacterium]